MNYANPDAIAHTGNYKASEEAVRVIDRELARVFKIALNPDTVVVITSDHGHVEELIDPMTGRAETQHAPNPVPLYIIADEFKGRAVL